MLERLFNNIATMTAHTAPSVMEAAFATAVLWQVNPVAQALHLTV